MEVLQVIIMPIVIAFGAIYGNNLINRKNDEAFKIRKEKEKELIEDIFNNYHYSSFSIEFDEIGLHNNTDDRFDKLKRRISISIKNNFLIDLSESIDNYHLKINEYINAQWNFSQNFTCEEDIRVLKPDDPLIKYKEEFFLKNIEVKEELDNLYKILNKILYS